MECYGGILILALFTFAFVLMKGVENKWFMFKRRSKDRDDGIN